MTTEQKIKVACKISNISLTELGRRLGLSQSAFSQRLKTSKFKQEELEQIAAVLGCEYKSIFIYPDGQKVE